MPTEHLPPPAHRVAVAFAALFRTVLMAPVAAAASIGLGRL